MKNGKIILLIVVILAALVTIVLLISNSNNQEQKDFYISKYSPNSLAYFNCKAEGMIEDNLCGKCEQIFVDADESREEHGIENDADLVEYVRSLNKDCVNLTAGGN